MTPSLTVPCSRNVQKSWFTTLRVTDFCKKIIFIPTDLTTGIQRILGYALLLHRTATYLVPSQSMSTARGRVAEWQHYCTEGQINSPPGYTP